MTAPAAADERQLASHDGTDHEIFDFADEEQILAELSGRVTDKYVYELKGVRDERGQPVIGLSYAGTNWACREYAKQGEVIRILRESIEMKVDPTDSDYVLVCVIAQRFAVNPETGKETALDTAPGIKRQWRKMKKKRYDAEGNHVGDDIVEDPFFWEKAVSKATRNAKQNLIPTDVVKKLIAKALENKNAGAPPTGGGGRRSQAPPKNSPAQQQQQPSQPSGSPASGAQSAGAAQRSHAAAKGSASPQAGSEAEKDSVIQKIDVVLKAVFNTQDGNVARQGLKKLCGKDKLSEFSVEDLKKYGKILLGVTKKTHTLSEDGTHIVDNATQLVVMGMKPAAAAAPATSGAPDAAPPSSGGGDGEEEKFF